MTKAPKNTILVDKLGRSIPLAAIAQMKVLIDDWGKKVRIYSKLKTGDATIFNYKVEDLWDLMEN